jgi:hypothetical protein
MRQPVADGRPAGPDHKHREPVGQPIREGQHRAAGRREGRVTPCPPPSFTAAYLPGDLDDDGKLVLVRRLFQEGLIQVL